MLKYPCLVLDHDDTVVQSEATVNYPCFCEYLKIYRPGEQLSLEEYMQICFTTGFLSLCTDKYRLTEEEMSLEYQFWQDYSRQHIPDIFPGIRELLHRYRNAGGLICVVSHSTQQTILRDYKARIGLLPDMVFGWDMPEQQRKPNAYPLLTIMEKYALTPEQMLVVDDMKPACQMARAVGSPIAFAGWGRREHPQIVSEMSALCDYCLTDVSDLEKLLF